MRENHHVFQHLIALCRDLEPIAVAVAAPDDDVSLQGALQAAREQLIVPVLVGSRSRILAAAQSIGEDISAFRIVDADGAEAAAAQAVALCRKADCAALMKGNLHTDVLMHEVMKADTGLRGARRLSHVFVMDVPNYPKLLLITDAAINIAPSLEDKADIVQNAIDLAQVLGIAQPKVAILSAVETVTPKIASTIDAAALCKMAERGQITGGIVDGPLAFDNAVSLRSARIKHIVSPVAGQADILVVPDLESGNMLAKQLEYLADAESAGIVLGARVPVVLTSRADSAKARLASCAVMAMLVHARRKGAAPQAAGSTA
jgi:phosphate acetyltransferase